MSLLLLLKPHPRRGGRGQKLVIQSSSPGKEEEVIALPVITEPVSQVSDEVMASLAKLGIKDTARDKQLIEDIKRTYNQAKAEGVSLEEMVLLYMMTER